MSRPIPPETAEVARRLCASLAVAAGEAERLPADPGSYGLLLRLKEPVTLEIARLGNPVLSAGLYLYCGSAKGPGGIRSRLGRHLRREKAVRWHIDHLSRVAEEIAGLVVPQLNECDLQAKASACFKARVPIAGFGSSDCRKCRSHLLLLVE